MFAAGGKPVRGTAAERTGPVGRRRPETNDAGRKRAAVELIARDGERLRRTARRYSLCEDDAEDAYQRALEILLTKAPTAQPRELLAWTTTVVKHEALAIRHARERLLGRAPVSSEGEPDGDWLTRLPSPGAGPFERVERSEEIARSREAIRALKPVERRVLALLGEGYSYAEIGEMTGFSQTKVNRSLAEGRERFRQIIASSEDGSRCAALQPLLSAFCDGETVPQQSEEVREHLRACSRCRAAMRVYRAAPATVAALCPLPLGLAAAGGAKGGGLSGLGKLLGLKQIAATCAVAGTAAGVASGIVPVPERPADRTVTPRIERVREQVRPARKEKPPEQPQGESPAATPAPVEAPHPEPVEPEPVEAAPEPVETVESEPAPTPAPAPEAGSAAGEFGP